MSPLVLALVLAAGSEDALSKVSLDKLSFKAPKAWEVSSDDEASKTWSLGDDAQLAVSAYAVEPQRPASACLDQMLEKLGGEGFEKLKVGAQPAAKKVTTDYVGEGEDAKRDENKVTTITVVGCNGRVRWVITWSAKTALGARFGPMFKRILDSVSYGK